VWSGGQMQDLGTLGGSSSHAAAINDRGVVTGESETASGEVHAFVWSGGQMQDLGVLPDGMTYPWRSSGGTAINERGDVTGWSLAGYRVADAFLWSRGQMVDLGSTNFDVSSRGVAINDHGDVAGGATGSRTMPIPRALVWTGGQIIEMGLGGAFSFAVAINNQVQVAGSASMPNDEVHAFRWSRGHTADLGTLGGATSYASAINKRGQVAGTSATDAMTFHAFLSCAA
jgi:probable HAF family extracellular repeat protein